MQIIFNNTNSKKDNFPIIGFFYSEDTNAYIDIYSGENEQILWNPNNLVRTDTNGIAIFSNLRLLGFDNSNSSIKCIKGYFYFKLGIDFSIQSENSPLYSFCIGNIYLSVDQKFDLYMIINTYLSNSIVGTFLDRNTALVMNSSHPLLFNIRVIYFDDLNISSSNSIWISNSLLRNSICICYNNTLIDNSCNLGLNPKLTKESSFEYKIDFYSIFWNYLNSLKRFDLAICLFNLCNYSSKSLTGIETQIYKGAIQFQNIFPSQIFLVRSFK